MNIFAHGLATSIYSIHTCILIYIYIYIFISILSLVVYVSKFPYLHLTIMVSTSGDTACSCKRRTPATRRSLRIHSLPGVLPSGIPRF